MFWGLEHHINFGWNNMKTSPSVFRGRACVQLSDKRTKVNIYSRNTLLNSNNNGQKFNLLFFFIYFLNVEKNK